MKQGSEIQLWKFVKFYRPAVTPVPPSCTVASQLYDSKHETKSFSTTIDKDATTAFPDLLAFFFVCESNSSRCLLETWRDVLQPRLHKTLERSRVQQAFHAFPFFVGLYTVRFAISHRAEFRTFDYIAFKSVSSLMSLL